MLIASQKCNGNFCFFFRVSRLDIQDHFYNHSSQQKTWINKIQRKSHNSHRTRFRDLCPMRILVIFTEGDCTRVSANSIRSMETLANHCFNLAYFVNNCDGNDTNDTLAELANWSGDHSGQWNVTKLTLERLTGSVFWILSLASVWLFGTSCLELSSHLHARSRESASRNVVLGNNKRNIFPQNPAVPRHHLHIRWLCCFCHHSVNWKRVFLWPDTTWKHKSKTVKKEERGRKKKQNSNKRKQEEKLEFRTKEKRGGERDQPTHSH